MHDTSGHAHEHHGKEETIAALRFMLRHNEHHAEELRELMHELSHLGFAAAAETLSGAVNDYECGNVKLRAALETTGEG